MLIGSTRILYFGQNKRASYQFKIYAISEYYPYIHSAPFNPTSADFCIVTYGLT